MSDAEVLLGISDSDSTVIDNQGDANDEAHSVVASSTRKTTTTHTTQATTRRASANATARCNNDDDYSGDEGSGDDDDIERRRQPRWSLRHCTTIERDALDFRILGSKSVSTVRESGPRHAVKVVPSSFAGCGRQLFQSFVT